jgi:hypothetical protein
MGHDSRDKLLPEFVVDMFDRIHPETVDAELGDHVLVDLDHALHHIRVLGEQVIQTDKIAVGGAFAGEGRVAAVVIVDGSFNQSGDFTVSSSGAGKPACRGS